MYAHDNYDRVVNNFDITHTQMNPLETWASSVMSWDASPANTSIQLLQAGKLGPYTVKNYRIFKCPADQEPSLAGPRLRSVAMNAFIGDRGTGEAISMNYQQFRKLTEFRNPAGIFVFVDEHPDIINDGFFVFCINSDPGNFTAWSDLPSSLHNGACGFNFADGHSEIKKWLAASTIRSVRKNGSGFPVTVGSDERDIRWVSEKSTTKL